MGNSTVLHYPAAVHEDQFKLKYYLGGKKILTYTPLLPQCDSRKEEHNEHLKRQTRNLTIDLGERKDKPLCYHLSRNACANKQAHAKFCRIYGQSFFLKQTTHIKLCVGEK